MIQNNEFVLSRLTVSIHDSSTSSMKGSGTLFYSDSLKNKVYVLTAAHCLYADGDKFQHPLQEVVIYIYNPEANKYEEVICPIDHNLTLADQHRDVAIILLDKDIVAEITGDLPQVQAVRERGALTSFAVKGFPNATKGQELASIFPQWAQAMTGVYKFQLHLREDYNDWATDGFSGSGVFLYDQHYLYLFGIFTRFRPEGKGRVIYCQYLDTINEVLEKNFLPTIPFTFLGEHGLTPGFFRKHVENAIRDLGPRFNEKLNLRLPIAQLFYDLAKGTAFKEGVLRRLDVWLTSRHYASSSKNEIISTIEVQHKNLQLTAHKLIPQLNWQPDKTLDLSPILDGIDQLTTAIESKREELYRLQREELQKEESIKRDYHGGAPYGNELSWLREVSDTNRKLLRSLHEVNIDLSNRPYLLIRGEAGSGKSHLLGDIAQERRKAGKPTLLLLGQLFKDGHNVWQNILHQLGLSCSQNDLLLSLNSIGRQVGERVLILVDALNEGAGKELWHDSLASFINEVARYPFIGMAMTVRSTYWDAIVPAALQNDKGLTRITHQGFKGNEYAALRLFCDHYGLPQPHFPILAPEFTSPLFLQLVCEGVNASSQRTFPQGFRGVQSVFTFYVQAVSQKLGRKRDDYSLRPSLAKQAILEFAKACFRQNKVRPLSLDEANELFDSKFPKFPHLLHDLVLENVLIQNMSSGYNTDKDILYFAYERFGDFFIAEHLLQAYDSTEALKKAFDADGDLGEEFLNGFWSNKGILEAMAVLLPEKHQLEIVEVYDWVFKDNPANPRSSTAGWLNQFLMDSLKWRTVQSIDDDKLVEWFNSENFDFDYHEYLNILIGLSTLPDHPFNSDKLFRILSSHSMPERDQFWQQYLLYYQGEDGDGNAYPITRLIDWAWQQGLSENIDKETARLAGQTLAWVLSTTDRSLRDRTTKAMVNLLEEQPEALIPLLEAFNEVDDMYIAERLYAVAYGCALRTSQNSAVLQIAQRVFNHVFSQGSPPKHILLRDYARNTVEYALYKQLPVEGDYNLIRPPYKSQMPEYMPTAEVAASFKLDYDAEDYKQKYGHAHNEIHHSVMTWDFGRYVVGSALTHFSPVSFTVTKAYREFLNGLKVRQRDAVKLYATLFEWMHLSTQQKKSAINKIGKDRFEETIAVFSETFVNTEKLLDESLATEQLHFFEKQVKPYLQSLLRTKDWQRNAFDTVPVRAWIVQRVFELGFNAEMHGPYESSLGSSYNNRHENKVERIGKKYQWIAFYEIMSLVADNYKLREGYGATGKEKFYQGPWQLYLRNIDPAFTSRPLNADDNEDDGELSRTLPTSNWWSAGPYGYWSQQDKVWVTNTQDLPAPESIIEKADEAGQKWLYLNLNITWEEPKPVGQDKYSIQRKDIWYMLQAYLMPNNKKNKVLEWLRQQDFGGRWLPESQNHIGLLNREHYWSPASQVYQREARKWQQLGDSMYKVILTTEEATGELSEDKSGAHFYYKMPCQTIFEGMKLQYGSIDGDFRNDKGDLVVSNVNPKGVLIRKKEFLAFLDENNLSVIWTLLGEKRAYKYHDHSWNNFSTLSGVYHMEGGNLTGSLTLQEDKSN